MRTITITPDILPKIQTLLSLSYGEKVSIEDEIEYYNPQIAKYWWATFKKEESTGFIRCFQIGTSHKYQLELFAFQQSTKELLLVHFLKYFQEKKNSSIRFCLNYNEKAFLKFLINQGFKEEAIYIDMNYQLQHNFHKNTAVRFAQNNASEITQIINLLKLFGGEPNRNRLQKQIQNQLITVICNKQNAPIGVCTLSAQNVEKEIIQLIISPKYRKQGMGKILMEQSIRIFSTQMPKLSFKLRVKTTNLPAIGLYKKLGFQEQLREVWLTKAIKP